MRYTLKDYQFAAANDILKALRRASDGFAADPNDYWSIALSAPTGAGKTVVAAAVIETLFDGGGSYTEDPGATVLWVTDDPALNKQTERNMMQASTTLGPGRLTRIDANFDQEIFTPKQVYFLNIQKLAKSNPLARSSTNLRSYSLWDTIANTISSNGAHFYVVIDEAHRGMKNESDRATIVSRIINGQEGINPPAPIVWGISATPERFIQAIGRWGDHRTSRSVTVPLDAVRASGLLKDKIILDNPESGQIEGDTTFIRAAVAQTLQFEESWRNYATAQNEPPVVPVLVVQVPNKPTPAEITEILAVIFGEWEGLRDENVINTFADHTATSAGGHTIAYMAPQEIQDDTDIRVVLCKDAISTGWDCPRAEVLVSLRRAEDYTYIAQLIGRMVRTPLARRITTDQTLNDVHCYLPRFNKQQVKVIVDRFAEGRNDEPPVEMILNPVVLERNDRVPDAVFGLAQSLPTYVVPGRIYRTQISRLHTLATLLAGDHIIEDAIAQVRIHLNGVLAAQRRRLESDGTFQAALTRVRSLRIERSYALLAVESIEDLPPLEHSYAMERDDNNIDDLYRVAMRKLPEGTAVNYWDAVITAQSADEYDPAEAKAVTAVLALHPEVVEAVESAAEQLVRTWLREHQRSISKLPDAKKAQYEPVKRGTRSPELTDLILPSAKVVSDATRWPKHLLVAAEGTFPTELRGWEVSVLQAELSDKDLVAWYRNPTGGNASLRIPFRNGQYDRSLYPDFVLFHQTDDGIRPSIVDPHGYHLADASAKLKGLADYAEKHADTFDRIDSVVQVDGDLLALDLRSKAVREAIRRLKDGEVRELFKEHAADYV